jgi:hypothetical protein
MIVFHAVEQGTSEWLELRKNLWTGSKATRLLQGKSMPRDYDFDGNDATRRGHALEAVAIMEYNRRYNTKTKRPGFVTNTVYPNAGYSPDGIAGGRLLEVKALNGIRHEALADGNIPLEFLVQVYFGMVITGKRKASLIAFNPEYEDAMTVLEITYNKATGNNIRKKLRLDMKKRQKTTL